uniref:Glycosyl hydrolases family 22 (GH22) domain-containing protein n=1 Tax=Salvator merianae TaxID=96440 RepID=A0A8D0BD52_SALMN
TMNTFHLFSFCLVITANEAKIFEICELFSLLEELGMENYGTQRLHQCELLVDCTTSLLFVRTNVNEDGIPHYGMFHLNGLEWCDNGRNPSKNQCKISCDKFLDDDIVDDVACVKKIASSFHGVYSW